MDPMNPAPAQPVSINQAKVSLDKLPGAKVGDVVQMKVARVDGSQNCAYLEPADGEEHGESMPSKEDSGEHEMESGAPVSTSLLTGPMSNLKNYLAQKSVDSQTRNYVG